MSIAMTRCSTLKEQCNESRRCLLDRPDRADGSGIAKPITVVSLFSGCGGLDLGLVGGFDFLGRHYPKTGFEILWANELNPAACRTYRENLGNYIVEGDIREQIANIPPTADIVVGGFPCQDISINGKMLGLQPEEQLVHIHR